jgi:hypothetical protein
VEGACERAGRRQRHAQAARRAARQALVRAPGLAKTFTLPIPRGGREAVHAPREGAAAAHQH